LPKAAHGYQQTHNHISNLTSHLASTRLGLISILGPVVFAFIIRSAWHRKRKVITGGAALAFLVSIALVIAVCFTPGTVSFWYNGAVFDNSRTSFAEIIQSGIPLTTDPAHGYVYAKIYPDPSNADAIEVSCTRDGVIDNGSRSTDLEWAYIVSGKFQTLWAPMPFVRGEVIGRARTLLPCSDWRWWLRDLVNQ
jgi:hypothetical protein